MVKLGYLFSCGLFVFLFCSFQNKTVLAQTQDSLDRRSQITGIPARLLPSLDERLRRFIEAQVAGNWEETASLLGRFYGGSRRSLFSQQHKDCLLTQMRAFTMTSFTTERISFSTEILGHPMAKRWWDVWGIAEFKTSSGISKSNTRIVAYLDQGKWFFTPPDYDNAWARKFVSEEDFLVNRSAELEIQLDRNCPVEVRDLNVVMERQVLASRKATFSLHNKTGKKIVSIGLRLGVLGEECFGISIGKQITINALMTSTDKAGFTYSAYQHYCTGELRHRLVIDSVYFADGSRWIDPKIKKRDRTTKCTL